LVFQPPRRNTITETTASVERDRDRDALRAEPHRAGEDQASGISHSQNQNRFITVGVRVWPAPLNARTGEVVHVA